MSEGGKEDYGEKVAYDPDFRGPVKSRKCTDIICLLIFVFFIAGWVILGIFAVREGNPKTLIYPTDSEGNICGEGELKDEHYLFFFNLRTCSSLNMIKSGCDTPQVCVKTCPNETFYVDVNSQPGDAVRSKLICRRGVDKKNENLKILLDNDLCAKLYLKSSPVLGRCIPKDFFKSVSSGVIKDENNNTINIEDGNITVSDVNVAIKQLFKFSDLGEVLKKVFSDFEAAWIHILCGLLFAMLLCLIWILLMRWIAGVMVWLSIALVFAFLAASCIYSILQYKKLKEVEGSGDSHFSTNPSDYLTRRKTWLAFAIVSGGAFVILALITICLRKRIFIAIALIKEASKAVGSVPTSLIFPIFPYILMLVLLAVWAVLAVCIQSSGKASFHLINVPAGSNYTNGSSCNPKKDYNSTGSGIECVFENYGMADNLYSGHAYNTFGLFWGYFFCIGIGQLALSGAFATYYWTMDKANLPKFTMATGLYICVRYHLGSIAFGSLLIAIVRMVRAIIEFADKQLKKYPNIVTRILVWCIWCFVWCLEKILKFISKNAYIMIAVHGKNFCTSARKAFFLLMRNILRTAVLSGVSFFLLLLGKLVVVALSSFLAFAIFTSKHKIFHIPDLNYALLPPVVIMVGTYFIACVFFDVYQMALDTLFLCFLEDSERNDGSAERPYFMSKKLMKILGEKNKFKEPKK